MRIPICKPHIDGTELAEVASVLQSGWLLQGPKVEQLERLVKEYVGAGFAVATSSCSTALHLAMRLCGIKSGDEVIIPSYTWVATAAAVEECGGQPVFCDIDALTFNIDSDLVEGLITARTRAIVAVNLFGLAADLPRIAQIAGKHSLYLVEDAACSLGATVNGRQSGTFGRVGCFSFHPRKSITTGEGGMIVGHREEDAALLRSLRSHGYRIQPSLSNADVPPYDLGDFDKPGYNYRLTDLQAAVGIAQLKKLDRIIIRRREIAATYASELADVGDIRLPLEPANYHHTYQSYCLMVEGKDDSQEAGRRACARRNDIMMQLQADGIATRPGTHAVHTLSFYQAKYGLANSTCPNAYRAMTQSIALPLYPTLTEPEIAYVIEKLKKAAMTGERRSVNASH
jgi:dTDP-4-amino-4,6-dideoxygalactose transaminase